MRSKKSYVKAIDRHVPNDNTIEVKYSPIQEPEIISNLTCFHPTKKGHSLGYTWVNERTDRLRESVRID